MLIPRVEFSAPFLTTLVAILGTTISPYLFFWQASQEAEDQRVDAQKTAPDPKASRRAKGIPPHPRRYHRRDGLLELDRDRDHSHRRRDFHATGKTDIETSAQAAEALRPIAGQFAEVIFALGIVGTGLLAIPVLAGSAAYAVGEGRRWPVGLARKPKEAVAFYAVLALSAAIGIILNFTPINPIQALYWSAVINGVLAVPVMVLLMVMARRRDVMGKFMVTGTLYWLGWLATAVMAFGVGGDGNRIGAVGYRSVLAENDRRHPARHQRHERRRHAVDQAVLPGGGGDELLEADLDDFERRIGLCDQRAVGKQFDFDVVGADRHLRREAGCRYGTGSASGRSRPRCSRGTALVRFAAL